MHPGKTIRTHAMRITAVCLAALLAPQTVLFAGAQQEPPPQPPAAQQPAGQQPASGQQPAVQQQPAVRQQQNPPALPAIPAEAAQPQPPGQDASDAARNDLPSAPEPQAPAQLQQQAPAQPPALPQQPVGTAAAPAEKPSGVPGSRPSGVAIAPAKQKRVRAFVISFGIALAGAAAIGTVVGLSKASHSTP